MKTEMIIIYSVLDKKCSWQNKLFWDSKAYKIWFNKTPVVSNDEWQRISKNIFNFYLKWGSK